MAREERTTGGWRGEVRRRGSRRSSRPDRPSSRCRAHLNARLIETAQRETNGRRQQFDGLEGLATICAHRAQRDEEWVRDQELPSPR